MSGFRDVTGWSSRDIQRLGHEDDDTPTTRTYLNKPKKPALNFNADDVWGAACAAQRINGSYVKLSMVSESDPAINQQSNRQIVEGLLADTSNMLDEDREQGKKVRQYYQAFTFKILKGIKLSEFDNNAMLISNRDTIDTNYDVAVIASLPSSYERGMKRANIDQRIKFATGGFIGTPSDRVTLTVEVLKTVYSQQWNTTYVTGITAEDQVVFFSYNHQIEIGQTYNVQGTVKAHRDNSTQLNRVKIV